ncbi:MAG: RNA polymerase subunit sigma-70 [Burkholderiaceae bacterium]|nr:RNA polymerase subunit sigma-70 [Burkholderiaceae bacterium]
MGDYRVRISVRNARLLRAIEAAGYRPGLAFAQAVGINYNAAVLPYLNLTRSPLNRQGLLRECAWSLCDFLGASPSDLWSDEQLQPLARNWSHADVELGQLQALLSQGAETNAPVRAASRAQAGRLLQEGMATLSQREAKVIHGRFFHDHTLEELATQFDLSRERVREIEAQALHKLRQDDCVTHALAGTADIIGGNADA